MIRGRWTVVTVVAVALALGASASVWAANRPDDRGRSDSIAANVGVPLPQTGTLQQGMKASQQQSKETAKLRNAITIADHFDVPLEAVLELRAQGAGFGLLVKVYALSSVTGESAEELLLSLRDDRGEFDFTRIENSLSSGEKQAFDELGLKGVGHLKNSQAKCPPGQDKKSHC